MTPLNYPESFDHREILDVRTIEILMSYAWRNNYTKVRVEHSMLYTMKDNNKQ